VETHKAWNEMFHRYIASTLGLLIVILAIMAWRRRTGAILPTFLVALVIFQGVLGMWTVTLLLKPAVVTAHLLGGMSTLALLWWLTLRESRITAGISETLSLKPLKLWAGFSMAILIIQITLGGWVSTNYSALVCPDFPMCQNSWWPPNMDFREGFTIWHGLGVNYEFGRLEQDARIAVQVTHRIGALFAFLIIGWTAICAWRKAQGNRLLATTAIAVGVLLIVQLSLGIANIWLVLPLPVAVAHNGGAALLLLAVLTLNYLLHAKQHA
ncbi:MAG: COX15/CtaA family protein, partial [Pseudomonadota bacterium]